MLKGISYKISPELLFTLSLMGHGDEIVLADANFPGHSLNARTIRADGLKIPELLDAILPLFELDPYVKAPLVMMAAVDGDTLDPVVEKNYRAAIDRHVSSNVEIDHIDRFEFYERAHSQRFGGSESLL